MARPFEYLNTDLDLVSRANPAPLLERLESAGVYPLHAWRGDDGLWYATLTGSGDHDGPEGTMAELLDAVESLPPAMVRRWRAARLREFNIGYQGGSAPWAFNQGLTAKTLRRLADARARLRITLYPIRRGRILEAPIGLESRGLGAKSEGRAAGGRRARGRGR